MKKLLAAMVIGLCIQSAAQATIYNDSTGDTFFGGILDIVSVEVTDNATDINFKFTLNGDIVATDWGKYMVMIDSNPNGDNVGNGWARPISWGQPGIGAGADFWLGSWVDSGNGVENRNWDGAAWQLQNASYSDGLISVSKTTSTATITVALSRIGLGLNESFCFDAFSSGGGGGDGAVDSLGNPGQQIADWGDHSDAHPVCYTTTPEPTTLGLLALGGMLLVRRRR